MAVSKSQKGSIVGDLHAALTSGEDADVTFVVGQSQVPAHRFILAARSAVFAAMFRNKMLEASSRRIQITDMTEAALRQLLTFIYTDTAPQLQSVAADLLGAADKYDLPLLKHMCEQQMERDLCVENAAATATLALLHNCPGLKDASVQFIVGYPEVLGTDGWAKLLRDNAEAAVQISKLVAAKPHPFKLFRLSTPSPTQASDIRYVSSEMRQKYARNLLEAARTGAVREVWTLLTAGAPKDACDAERNTALHLAASNGHATTAKCLLDLGLDVNAANGRNETPLHLAVRRRDRDIIWMLVAASAKVNAQDNQGQTPLHVAAKFELNSFYFSDNDKEASKEKMLGVVKTLLLTGARKDIKDRDGKISEEVATSLTKSVFRTSFSP